MSAPLRIASTNKGTSSGGCERSAPRRGTPPPRGAAAPASTADASPALPDRCITVIGTGPDFAIWSATNPVPSGEASSTMITSTASRRPTSASPETSRGRESRSLYVGTTTERTGSRIPDPGSGLGAGPVVSPGALMPWYPGTLVPCGSSPVGAADQRQSHCGQDDVGQPGRWDVVQPAVVAQCNCHGADDVIPDDHQKREAQPDRCAGPVRAQPDGHREQREQRGRHWDGQLEVHLDKVPGGAGAAALQDRDILAQFPDTHLRRISLGHADLLWSPL